MQVTIETGEGKRSFRRTWVAKGRAGNLELVELMVRAIRNATDYDLGVKRLAANLLENVNLDSSSDQLKQLQTFFNFAISNIAYIEDEAGNIDSLKSARVTISDGFGDCDDLTVLICTLCGAVGFEDVNIALARYDDSDTTFVHVYPVVYTRDGTRVVMDATLHGGRITDEVTPLEIKEIPVFNNTPGIDGFSGLINNIRYHGVKIGKTAIETLPQAANYLPLNFLSSNALSAGAQMLNHSMLGDDLSFCDTASKINQELDSIIFSLINCQIALDLAHNLAVQTIAPLTGMDKRQVSKDDYETIKQSIGTKLDFIKNFEGYAQENHIPVVKLNGKAMVVIGAVGAGYGAYKLYQTYKRMN